MQGSLDQPPVVIRPTRLLLFPIATAPIAIVVLVIVVVMSPSLSKTTMPLPIIGTIPLSFFLVGAMILVESLAMAFLGAFWAVSRLEIGQGGLTRRSLVGRRLFAWNEIGQILVKTNNDRYRTQSVHFELQAHETPLSGPPRGGGRKREINLASFWEVRPDPLAKLLNEARDRWGPGR